MNDKELGQKIAQKALRILHCSENGEESDNSCSKSCYSCICTFYNQRDHKFFDRSAVKDFLLKLAAIDEVKSAVDQNVQYDAFMKSDFTSLEKNILQKLKEQHARIPAEVHKIISKDGEPIAEADFYYDPKICIFIDGPDHDKRFHQN